MKRRARTMALARGRRPPELWLLWIVLMLALGLAAIVGAHAQTTAPPAPMPPKTESTGPTLPSSDGTGTMERGVIRPPGPVDSSMNKGVPNPQAFPTPVIPPPGTPGGNPRVEPKLATHGRAPGRARRSRPSGQPSSCQIWQARSRMRGSVSDLAIPSGVVPVKSDGGVGFRLAEGSSRR